VRSCSVGCGTWAGYGYWIGWSSFGVFSAWADLSVLGVLASDVRWVRGRPRAGGERVL